MPDRSLRASTPQAVTFVELFFDLVFVFAITQVTVLAASDLTPAGILRALVVFWLVWWAWTQFTWTLNPADATHPVVRVVTLVATAAAFVMATAIPNTFGDGALWFAIPYVAVRGIGLWLQVRVDMERTNVDRSGIVRWAVASVPGLVVVLLGALADPSIRPWAWLGAAALDLVAATIAGGSASWDLNPAHLVERHGLIEIIAIGEALIVAGAAVAGQAWSPALIAAAGAAVVAACLLWWTYFGWFNDAAEHAMTRVPPSGLGQAARDAFSLAHFPLIAGIIGFAVGIKDIVGHPDEPSRPEVVLALGVGVALFVGFSAVSWRRLGGGWLPHRLAIVVLMVPGLVLAAPLAPVGSLVVVAVALAAIVAIEELRPPTAGHAPG